MSRTETEITLKKNRQAGFNLVEMMVTCVVIGVLLAVAAPDLAGRNARNRCEGAARNLSVRMQIARQAAVASRTPHRMIFDADAMTYYFEKYQPDSTWTQSPDEVYEMNGVASWDADVGGSSNNTDVVFETRGTLAVADSPALFTFVSTNADSASLSVVRTGRCSITMAYN